MIYISRIKMRGFKSFKLADIALPRDFVCLAGPNGSGKSNICDAVRFACGETSLKTLRAKKTKDLISHNTKMAEVTLWFDGDEKHEIKRAIREDGKILYRLDGARTTRTSILNILKKFNIDESGRSTIAQGEVNRIITMNAKERREIIDDVAGISEFETKKREAIKDLEIVETRLREANIILGEKIGVLNELEKEKEIALKYIENRKLFNNARGSLVKKEIDKLSSEQEKVIWDLQKINANLKTKQAEIFEFDEKIKQFEQEKNSCLSEIEARQKQGALTKKIDALRLGIGMDGHEIIEKRGLVTKLENEIHALKEEIKKESEDTKKTEEEFAKTEKECIALKTQCEGGTRIAAESKLRKTLKDGKERIGSLKIALMRAEAECVNAEQLIAEKKSTLEFSLPEDKDIEQTSLNEIEILKKEIAEAKFELENRFEKEKEVNAEIAEIERRILTLREKIAAFRAQNPRIASSTILDFINQLKTREKIAGIHGALIDMIKFDAKYANAIEASAGVRLMYIIVDDANTATAIIKKIKESAVGRTTFIPLKELNVPPSSLNTEMDALIKHVNFEQNIEKAVRYVFGDTALVPDMEEAKRAGIGKYRMVTLDGEIFEKSGVITGGKSTTGIAAAKALSKLENEVSDLKTTREEMFAQLSNIREEMSQVRSVRTEKEVRMKSLEVELSILQNEKEKAKKRQDETAKKKAEIIALESTVKTLVSRKTELEREISLLSEKNANDEELLATEEHQLAKQNEEARKKHTELVAKISSLETKHEALFNEVKLRKTGLHKLEANIKNMNEEKSEYKSKISEIERKMSGQKDELEKMEQELASSSKELEALFRKMKEDEEKIFEIGKQKGAISFEIEKLNKELGNLTIKKTSTETRLIDFKVEIDSFKEFEFIDKPKDELMEIVKKADSFLSANQVVNLVSIELYEKKNAEIDNVQDRMEKLKEETNAIMKMIAEIDARKKDAFFKTFYAVNDNFRKMFKHIPQIGEGYIYLDKPNEPFESGLHLKIKRGTKEMGLESLSGGENSLIALMFIFALQFVKPSPYYILDEVDSALDKENSKNLAKLIKEMSKNSQFVLVTHNDIIMMFANAVFGVSKVEGTTKIVGVRLGGKEDGTELSQTA